MPTLAFILALLRALRAQLTLRICIERESV